MSTVLMRQEKRKKLILSGKGKRVRARYCKGLMNEQTLVYETKGNGFWKGMAIITFILILFLTLLLNTYITKPPYLHHNLIAVKHKSQLICSACKQSRSPYHHVAYGETEAQRNKLASQITQLVLMVASGWGQ